MNYQYLTLHKPLLRNIKSNAKESQAPLALDVISLFVEEMLNVFFMAPMDFVGMKDFQRKIVTSAVSTIKKAIDFTLGKIIKSLSNKDLAAISQYMDVMLQREEEGSNPPAYIAFPLDDTLEQRLHEIFARVQAGDAKKEVSELITVLLALHDAEIKKICVYLDQLVKVGPEHI